MPGGSCGYDVHTTDWSDNSNTTIGPADLEAINGTYNRDMLSARAASIIAAHNPSEPLYLYLAFQDVHEGCSRPDELGMQAPLAYVDPLYNTTKLDTYKVRGA